MKFSETQTKTRDILRKASYSLANSIFCEQAVNSFTLEFWVGPGGGIVLQHWDNSERANGTSSYIDTPLGHTFEELEAALVDFASVKAGGVTQSAVIQSQAARIRDLASENSALQMQSEMKIAALEQSVENLFGRIKRLERAE